MPSKNGQRFVRAARQRGQVEGNGSKLRSVFLVSLIERSLRNTLAGTACQDNIWVMGFGAVLDNHVQ